MPHASMCHSASKHGIFSIPPIIQFFMVLDKSVSYSASSRCCIIRFLNFLSWVDYKQDLFLDKVAAPRSDEVSEYDFLQLCYLIPSQTFHVIVLICSHTFRTPICFIHFLDGGEMLLKDSLVLVP